MLFLASLSHSKSKSKEIEKVLEFMESEKTRIADAQEEMNYTGGNGKEKDGTTKS